MEVLEIEPTESSPKVVFDAENDQFLISGESRPEDVRQFYKPVLSWLDQYSNYLYWLTENYSIENRKNINFCFEFEYFNSSSAKYIMDMMTKLSEIQEHCPNAEIMINWNYDEPDEDMFDAGKEFEDIAKLPFNFISVAVD